jgi:hypothetical protein
MYVSWFCTRMYLCIKIHIRLVLPPPPASPATIFIFIFFNFVISKIWTLFPKNLAKIFQFTLELIFNGPFFHFFIKI